MTIRVQAKGSAVYHLQDSRGHAYWSTWCGRRWMSHAYTDEDGCCFERLDIMPEISEWKAQTLQLCKQCRRDWEHFYSAELKARDEEPTE